MKKSYIITLGCWCAITAMQAQSLADSEKETATLDQYKITQFAFKRANASALSLGQWLNFSDIVLGVKHENGSYHRPQQPGRETNYLFSAEGALKMGDYFLAGGFDFKQTFNRDVRFTSILDPYRGTPYILADSTGGDWQKQAYKMWAKGASPFFYNCISLGLDVQLGVARGAKKTDPRPQSNVNEIAAAPSVTFKFDEHAFGGYVQYKRFKENSNLILYNASEPQKVYLLKGMGQYIYDIFSTNERERQYSGNGWGYGVEYNLNNRIADLNIYGDYSNYTEEVCDIESNKPRKRGRLYETLYKTGVNLNIYGELLTHTISADFTWRERSGREIIQLFNPASNVNAWITDAEAPRRSVNLNREINGKYTLFIATASDQKVAARARSYTWRLDLSGGYTQFQDRYEVMNSYLCHKTIHAEIDASRNFKIGHGHLLQLRLTGGYYLPKDKQFNYVNRDTEDNTIEQGLMLADRNILGADYYTLGADALFSYRLPSAGNLYLQAGYNTLQAKDNLSRNYVSARFGYLF